MLHIMMVGMLAVLLPLPVVAQEVPVEAREQLVEDLARAQEEIRALIRWYVNESQRDQEMAPVAGSEEDQQDEQMPLLGQELTSDLQAQEQQRVGEAANTLAQRLMDSMTARISQLRESYNNNPYYRVTGFSIELGLSPSVVVVFEFVSDE